MLELALRDPSISSSGISDDLYFEQTFEQVKAQEQELQSMRGPAYTDTIRMLYIDYIKMIYFLEDLKTQRYQSTAKYTDLPGKISTLRSRMISYATKLAQSKTTKSEKTLALYHVLTHKYLEGQELTRSLGQLKKIQQHLTNQLKIRSNLLFLHDDALRLGKKIKAKKLDTIARGLNTNGAIAAYLTQAKIYAGLNYKGQVINSSSSSYKKSLQEISRRAHKLSTADRNNLFIEMLSIWNRIEKRSTNWASPPFNIKPFSDSKAMLALIERKALYHLGRKQNSKALKIYEALSGEFINTTTMVEIDTRILNLKKKYSRNLLDYESTLINYQDKYRNLSVANIDTTSMKRRIEADHRSLIYGSLKKASGRKASNQFRQDSIAATERYLQIYKIDHAEKIRLQEKIAAVHVAAGNRAIAVQIYVKLKNELQDERSKSKFRGLAIQHQSILASWPTKNAPWLGFKPTQSNEREYLATLYSEEITKQKNWRNASHLGLLYTDLGRGAEAFSLWTEMIDASPRAKEAALASGYMSQAFVATKSWDELESISRLVLKRRIQPKHRGKNLNPRSLLADALFNGGKSHFSNQAFKKASQKLSEFVRDNNKDSRIPEAYYFLGQSYHFSKAHVASIETMMTLVTDYPESKYSKEALVLGSQWSMPMAFEDQSMFFSQEFINRHQKDPRVKEHRQHLIELYKARQLYGNAARIYQDISLDETETKENQIAATLSFIEIEERYGDEKQARWGLKRMEDLSPNDPYVQSKQYAFDVRLALEDNDLAKIKRLEHKLSQIPSSEPEVIEATAQARLIIARSSIEKDTNKELNISLENPYKTLKKKYDDFTSSTEKLRNVCDAGTSSYCAKAMLELSELCLETLKEIDDITLPQTLSSTEVDRFENLKLSFIDKLTDTAKDADNAALGLSDNGATTPDTARQVYWNNYEEWDHEADNPSSGNGYIQWQPAHLE